MNAGLKDYVVTTLHKPRIVVTPRTDGLKWQIQFGWGRREEAERHSAMLRDSGVTNRGMLIDWSANQANPLAWCGDRQEAIRIAIGHRFVTRAAA